MEKRTSAARALFIAPGTPEVPEHPESASYQDHQASAPVVSTRDIFLVQDITDRKQADDTMARLASIVESSQDAIISASLNGAITSWNTGAERVFGYSASEVVGQLLSLLMPPGQENDLSVILARICKGECVPSFETVRLRKDGSLVPVSLSVFPLRDRSGSITAASAIARDITERKQAEREIIAAHAEALRARDETAKMNTQLQQAVEKANELRNSVEREYLTKSVMLAAISSILISVNAEDRIIQWNAAAEMSFGIAASAVLGQSFSECGIQWNWPVVQECVATCRRDSKLVRLNDFRFTRPGNMEGILGITLTSIHTGGKQQAGFLLVGADITERKFMESQLAHAQKMESIGHLAAGIAHEINTPTQYIGDNNSFLKEAFEDLSLILTKTMELVAACKGGTASPEFVAGIEAIIEQVGVDYLLEEIPRAIQQSQDGIGRVTKIVQAMKEFSHPGTKEKTETDINRAIESTITVACNEWKYVADVITELDLTLPPVLCLPDDFNQVILNLVINATHAIAELGNGDEAAKGVITIRTRLAGDWVEVHIADTGPGIPESIGNRVFDPFFTTKEVGKGTGQGLAIAHSIMVDKHGGTIHFETEMGKGTTFILRLPLGQAQPCERTKAA